MKWNLVFFGLSLIVASYVLDFTAPHDDTDPPGGRSGVRLITDHATGCQYLSTGMLGSITPRIDSDYMHRGCRGAEDENATP